MAARCVLACPALTQPRLPPSAEDITEETLHLLPQDWEKLSKNKSQIRNATPYIAKTPQKNVTTRASIGSVLTLGPTTGTTSRKSIKISITDFPKFSGKAKDWLVYERKFTSVAATQGYAYVLDDEEFQPMNDEEDHIYSEDKAYIYNAFKLNWAEASNYHLVEKYADIKDGREVYKNAKQYFRGEAVEDALLLENIHDLVNNKLTSNSLNGAEGYNNKFNDACNTITTLGHTIEDKILKCIYLSNIQDRTYDTIKDQTTLPKLSLHETQTLIMKKYLTSLGDRRPTAP